MLLSMCKSHNFHSWTAGDHRHVQQVVKNLSAGLYRSECKGECTQLNIPPSFIQQMTRICSEVSCERVLHSCLPFSYFKNCAIAVPACSLSWEGNIAKQQLAFSANRHFSGPPHFSGNRPTASPPHFSGNSHFSCILKQHYYIHRLF